LTSNNLPHIKPLITNYKFKPYYYYNINNRKLSEYFFSLIKKENIIFTLEEEEKGLGAASVVNLPWDSEIFEIKMAKIGFILTKENYSHSTDIIHKLIGNILIYCREKGIKHISFQVNSQEISLIHALEKNGFTLMDTIIIYSISLKNIDFENFKLNLEYFIREAKKKDLPAMQELAGKAFFTPNMFLSRFYVDPLLRKRASILYKEWLKNSFNGEQADIVLVAEIKNKPVGFITCQLPKRESIEIFNRKIATIPLNAVSSKFRGRGVYNCIMEHALKWFKEQEVDIVEIKTQIINLPVQRVWHKYEGKVVSSYHTFHKEL